MSHSFKTSRDDKTQYAFETFEMFIDDDKKQVIGSFIYECASTSDLILKFYSASLDEPQYDLMDFP